jgi:glycosyltransferase involved in cell wall biosynthesis
VPVRNMETVTSRLLAPIRSHAGSIYRSQKARLSHRFDEGVAAYWSLLARSHASHRLLILDDMFPQMLSAFRIAEYNAYLEHFEDARVCSTATAFPLAGETRPFREVVREYENYYPQYRGRVLKYTPTQDMRSGLVYTIFINNAYEFIDVAERYGSPLVFTLYPGGGFRLGDRNSDSKLRRVLSSPSFRKVIVTQQITYDYLVEQRLCLPNQIQFIYGGVLPSHLLSNNVQDKRRFRENKNTFDICFVANKQMQRGVDKGYDVFIEVARLLSGVCKEMVFHIVGPFDADDIDVRDIEDRVHFYGWRHTSFFPEFYATMDIILSPNRPFVLGPGLFDGFPTGCCIEAGLCGVAVFCTDPLQQNGRFQDGQEIVILRPNAEEICDQVLHYYDRLGELYALSSQGQQAFREVFDLSAQMKPRLDTLSSLLKSNQATKMNRRSLA